MKKFQLLLLLVFAFLGQLTAQPEPKITEQVRANSQGTFNALVMELPGKLSSINSVKKEWGSFVKHYKGKVSYNKKADEYFSDDAKIKEMSENTVDIYCKIVPKDADHLEVVVWFNLGVTYLSSSEYAQGMAAAQTMLKDFSKIVYLNIYEDNLKAEEALLKNMDKALNSTKKEADSFDKKIKDYENEIAKIQKKIAEVKESVAANNEKQAKQKKEINDQEKKIDNLKKEIEQMKRKRR